MTKFQLWGRDEYGQGSIHATSENIQELLKQAESLVNSANVENALTVEDKKRNWEAYVVHLDSKKGISFIYGGRDNHGNQIIYSINKKEIKSIPFDKNKMVPKVYLGNLDKKDWYATDNRGKEINSLDHPDLISKMIYFIKQIA